MSGIGGMLKLLELYPSVQGEGPNVGKPTTFVRFAGCNLRCPGWPCDTPYSIFPEQWKSEAKDCTPQDLYLWIKNMPARHICITGGEPLIQPRADMVMLLANLLDSRYTIDIFTNGTMPIIRPMDEGLTYVLDWKLAGSGEGQLPFNQTNTREANRKALLGTDAIKFTVKDRNDMYEARDLIVKWRDTKTWESNLFRPKFYMGPVWEGEVPPRDIIEFLADNGLWDVYLNLQIHKYVFDPAARGI